MNKTKLLQGSQQLAIDATLGVVDLVETVHSTISKPLARRRDGRTGGITGLVYRSVRGITKLVGGGLDLATQFLPEASTTDAPSAATSILNGICGDHLASSGNPLAIRMQLIRATDTRSSGQLLVAIHGLCMDETSWCREDHNHAESLATEFGLSLQYLRYNTGLGIAENGEHLANLLQSLVNESRQPVAEINVLAHSMGGLIIRSACAFAAGQGHSWPKRLRRIVFLGTPHHGAPLEKAGSMLDQLLGVSAYSAPFARIGKVRSAGIVDLRSGHLPARPEDTSVLDNTACFAIAATRQGRSTGLAGPHVVGDGLVTVPSALGHHRDPSKDLDIPPDHQFIVPDTGHFGLLSSQPVYAKLLSWFNDDDDHWDSFGS